MVPQSVDDASKPRLDGGFFFFFSWRVQLKLLALQDQRAEMQAMGTTWGHTQSWGGGSHKQC